MVRSLVVPGGCRRRSGCLPPGEAARAHPSPSPLAAAPEGDIAPGPAVRSAAEPASVVLVVLDGARWQEVFVGADPKLAASHLEPSTAAALMPHLHALVSARGAAVGAPGRGAPMTASGPNFVSLPGYTEIFTGHRVHPCGGNDCAPAHNPTLFDEVRANTGDPTQVAVFASWEPIARAATRDPDSIVLSTGRSQLSRRGRSSTATRWPAICWHSEPHADPYPGQWRLPARPIHGRSSAALPRDETPSADVPRIGGARRVRAPRRLHRLHQLSARVRRGHRGALRIARSHGLVRRPYARLRHRRAWPRTRLPIPRAGVPRIGARLARRGWQRRGGARLRRCFASAAAGRRCSHHSHLPRFAHEPRTGVRFAHRGVSRGATWVARSGRWDHDAPWPRFVGTVLGARPSRARPAGSRPDANRYSRAGHRREPGRPPGADRARTVRLRDGARRIGERRPFARSWSSSHPGTAVSRPYRQRSVALVRPGRIRRVGHGHSHASRRAIRCAAP